MSEQDRFSTQPGTTFIPFWKRLPRFLLYPLQFGSMLRIAGYSILIGIAVTLLQPFSILIPVLVWIVFFKYAFLVMERTANGRFDEPDNMTGPTEGDIAQVLRQYGLLMVFGAVYGLLVVALRELGLGLGWLMMNLLAPAGIMIIAVTRSFWQALNPARIFFYVRTIGSPYLALCFLLITVSASGRWLEGVLLGFTNRWVAWPVYSFVEFYFTLIAYHMMGYVIYQYHDKLGLRVAVSFEDAAAQIAPGNAADIFQTKLAALIADGKQDEALSLLREELRLNLANNELHERYFKLLLAAGKESSAMNHAREFIHKLVNEKHLFQAVDLYAQCLGVDPKFQLQDPNHVITLAEAANTGNHHDLALRLMRGFDKRHPGHPHIPQIYLLSAKTLSEFFRKDREAIRILQALQTRFPDHPVAAEARQYLKILQKYARAN